MRIKQRAIFIVVLLFTIFSAVTVYAHPGKTDSNGGHTDRSTGEYHYHHGYPAHNHSDLDGDGVKEYCPYDHDDATDHKNAGGSSNKSSTNSKKPSSPAPSSDSESPKRPSSSVTTTDSTDRVIIESEDESLHLQPLSIAALLLAVFTFFIPVLFEDFTIKDGISLLLTTLLFAFFIATGPMYLAVIILAILNATPNIFYCTYVISAVITCVMALRKFKKGPLNKSDSLLFITYCEALSMLGSTIITQNIPSPSGAGTFFITLLALCILVWVYYRFRPNKVAPNLFQNSPNPT